MGEQRKPCGRGQKGSQLTELCHQGRRRLCNGYFPSALPEPTCSILHPVLCPGSLWATVEGTSWQGISVHLGLSHLCEPGQLAHTSLSAFRLPLLEFDALHRVLESAPLWEGKWDGIWVPEDWEELCGPSRLPLGGPTPLRRSADSNPGGQGGRFWPKGTSSSSELRQTCCCGCCPGGFGHRQGAMWTSALLLPLLESSISRASRITDFLLSR